MVITILAEPRSGSTNLTNWFYHNRQFTTLFNPNDSKSNWYNQSSPSKYLYPTKHLLIKVDFYHYKDYSEFIEISDKVICLYRVNENEQIESWINAKCTNNWSNEWKFSKNDFNIDEKETIFFKQLKQSFIKRYLSDESYFKITYEELYYNNGFQKIVDYLDLDCVKNENFPIGKKYRVTAEVNKLI